MRVISNLRNFVLLCIVCSNVSASPENDLEEISDGPLQITFAGSQFYPPLEWTNTNNTPDGFITDLQYAMFEKTNDQIETRLMKWEDAINSVLDGSADAMAMIPSEERLELFDFTQPFYYVSHGIFVNSKGAKYERLMDLKGRKVAMVKSAFALSNINKFDYDIQILPVDTELECLLVVEKNIADVCIEVTISSNALIEENNLNVEMSGPSFWPQPYAFGVKKGNELVLNKLKTQLAKTFVDGSYHDVYDKWEDRLETDSQNLWTSILHLSWLLLGLGVAICFFFSVNQFLRKKIAEKTSELEEELANSRLLQEQNTYNYNYDHTTDLLNRRAFFEVLDCRLNRHMKEKEPLYVVAIRLTNFVSVISVFGYNSAMDIAVNVSKKLKQFDKSIASYFGSGVFVISLYSKQAIDELVQTFSNYLDSNYEQIEPLPVFGVSDLDEQLESKVMDSSELVRRAITAMSYAEQKRVNLFCYTKEIEPDSRNIQLLNDYQKVGCQQFLLHYQPQVDINSGVITHVEALIRWEHPKYGMVPPYLFIPLLEESGNITAVTRWVLQEVILFINANKSTADNITFSINITTRDLVDENFVNFVKGAVKDLRPNSIIFEVTETELVEETDKAKRVMEELEELGVSCAVDDYGTGYSSLSYLHELSVNEIKLDRSLILNLNQNDRALKIVDSTIKLAHALGLQVVAEGVEDMDIYETLALLKCDRIQGYLISKPVPEHEIKKLLGVAWQEEMVS